MTYDYDKIYGETREALGQPSSHFVEFFHQYRLEHARVLDVGCGQGRDALCIARKGHKVVGVDISPNGIRDLDTVARRENLAIEGVVADIATYTPEGTFDVVVVDRVLHMIAKPARLGVLNTLLGRVRESGWLLIADESSNIREFEGLCSRHDIDWRTTLSKRGYLFLNRP